MKHQTYTNIWIKSINRSKICSLLALQYNKPDLCCYCRFILIFVVKDTQKLSKSRTQNPKPGFVIPWTPIQSFWYIEYGIILDDDDGANNL